MSRASSVISCWLRHRLMIIDGSSFSMPDTPELSDHFGHHNQKRGCGFPTGRWLAVMHFGSGLIEKVLTAPWRSHDYSLIKQVHPELKADDVLIGDRAYSSFVHLALLVSQHLHGIFRAHQLLILDFTPHRAHVPPKQKNPKRLPRSRWVKSLGKEDQLVEWYKPYSKVPAWLTKRVWKLLPSTLLVRELRYTIARPGFRVHRVALVTTLLDPVRYPKEKLAEAYGL